MGVHNYRKKYLVDRDSQFGIAKGITFVWILGTTLIASFPLLAMAVYGMLIAMNPTGVVIRQVLDAAVYPAVMGLLMIPICVLYAIKFSNRISGPVFRINRELIRLNAGEPTNEIHLRDNDYFQHVGDTFNATRQKVLTLEERVRELEQGLASVESDSLSSHAPKTGAPSKGIPVGALGLSTPESGMANSVPVL
jgi:methyl-accepting chemotaxis protein